jgi:hypothetical protein
VTLQEVHVLRFLERDDPHAALLFGASMRRGIRHQVGAALDWPVGRRFFGCAWTRGSSCFASGLGSESALEPN